MSDDGTGRVDGEEQEDVASSATLKADSSEDLDGADPATSDTNVAEPEAAGSPSQDLTGQSLAGRYTVLEKLGSGGMSVVYLARHELLKKLVAVKVLRAEQALRKDAKARFHREAKAAASIEDPHIVDITDYGFTERGDAFIVMERLDGESLRATVAREGALSTGRAVAIARQILRGLSSAHDQGIIHRDLKAENVFLCQRDGKDFIKLLDFGISKVTRTADGEEETGLTTTGQVLGTPQYLAPEQAHGIEHVDHRADLYAMGVILYEMLTGGLPFTGKSVFEVVMKHVQDAPQPPRERRPDLDIPVELERVTLKALTKEPKDRYQSAQEMLDALPGSGDLPGGYTSQSLTPVGAPGRSPRRGAAIAAALVLAAGIAGWLVLRQRSPMRKPAVAPPVVALDMQQPRAALPPDLGPRPDARPKASLEVRATPAKAVIQINGRALGSGEAMTEVRPGARVTIEVSAPGYHPHRQELTVEKNTMIPVSLRRAPRAKVRSKRGSGDLQQNPYR